MALVNYPVINGNGSYQHSSIRLFVNNLVIIGAKSIDYEDALMPSKFYGTSPLPIARTEGKYTSSGKIELNLPDWDALLNNLGPNFMTATFQINVSYSEPGPPSINRLDILNGCRIEKVSDRSSEGENVITVVLDLNVMSIEHNGFSAVSYPPN